MLKSGIRFMKVLTSAKNSSMNPSRPSTLTETSSGPTSSSSLCACNKSKLKNHYKFISDLNEINRNLFNHRLGKLHIKAWQRCLNIFFNGTYCFVVNCCDNYHDLCQKIIKIISNYLSFQNPTTLRWSYVNLLRLQNV